MKLHLTLASKGHRPRRILSTLHRSGMRLTLLSPSLLRCAQKIPVGLHEKFG